MNPVVLAWIEINPHDAHELQKSVVVENSAGALVGDDHLLRVAHDEL